MSGSVGILPAYVRYNRTLNASAKLLYSEITANLDKYGLYCKLTNRELAEKLGFEERSIQRLLATLVTARVIEKVLVGNVRTISLRIPAPTTMNKVHSEEMVNYTEEVVSYWNGLFACSIAYRSGYVDMLAERLKKYSKKDIAKAMKMYCDMYSDNPYWKEKRKELTNITNIIADDEAISKFLEIYNKKHGE